MKIAATTTFVLTWIFATKNVLGADCSTYENKTKYRYDEGIVAPTVDCFVLFQKPFSDLNDQKDDMGLIVKTHFKEFKRKN